jgi:small redox-active disulfide protein 2
MSKEIKVLGTGCPKCKTTYNNVLEALKQLGMEANVTKIEDIEEMMKYNVLTTPVLMIDDVMKVKGRIAQIDEIKELLKNSNSVSEDNNSSCCSDSNCC